MINDPIVEEIHKIRRQHSEKYNFDLRKIYESIKSEQEKNIKKTVSRSPKTYLKATG